MAAYKEIVTKAIVGKGKKSFKNTYTAQADNEPSTILGCWIINHNFKGSKINNQIGVTGSYDVNIWYSYDNDSKTAVINKKIDYEDLFNVTIKEDANIDNNTDIIVRCLKQPSCSDVNIKDGKTVSFNIEKELGVEVVGESKIKIATIDGEEPWEELSDNDVMKEIDESIDENYIKEETTK